MKKIVTDRPGSGSAVVLDMILSSLGLSGSIEVVQEEKSLDDQIAGLLNGDHDGVFRMATQGDRAVTRAMGAGGVNLVGIDQWSLEGHTARYSFVRPTTIPSETYPAQFVPVPSVSTQYVLASPVETVQEAGEVGPGTAGVAGAVPIAPTRSRRSARRWAPPTSSTPPCRCTPRSCRWSKWSTSPCRSVSTSRSSTL